MNGSSNDIIGTTMLIQRVHPELSKYLEEMPVTIPDMNNPVISRQVLVEYNKSLLELLNKYAATHI